MGTCNFNRGNTSRIFAVLMNYEDFVLDEDGNETEEKEMRSCNDYEVEWLINSVEEKIEGNKGVFEFQKGGKFSDICALYTTKKFGDIPVELYIKALLHGGYYEGASLDWEFNYYVNGSDSDIGCIGDCFKDATSNMNKGMLQIQSRNAQKWAEKTAEKMIQTVEKVFTNISEPLKLVGMFSNGEAIYEKC